MQRSSRNKMKHFCGFMSRATVSHLIVIFCRQNFSFSFSFEQNERMLYQREREREVLGRNLRKKQRDWERSVSEKRRERGVRDEKE